MEHSGLPGSRIMIPVRCSSPRTTAMELFVRAILSRFSHGPGGGNRLDGNHDDD